MNSHEINVKIENCNNIQNAEISILKDHLNIKYAMNGIGKSSIAKVIDTNIKNESLERFKPFGSDNETSIETSEPIGNSFLFDEEFISNMVFKESEVISNSFEVFIKTEDYDEKLEKLNKRLKELKIDIGQNEEIVNMLSIFKDVSSNIALNASGDSIKKNPFVKSLLSKENIFNVPKELQKYKSFFENEDHNIDWIDWKNKGSNYDSISGCPYCAEQLSENYEEEKDVFGKTYQKTSTKHMKDMLEYFDKLQLYINQEKLEILHDCIKKSDDGEYIELNLKKFIEELTYLRNKITETISFDSSTLNSEEISKLGDFVNGLKIEIKGMDVFSSEKTIELINEINGKIEKISSEVESLKNELGMLKGTIQSAAQNSINDINVFLNQAGINYEFAIIPESQTDSRTILKYVRDKDESIEVNNIPMHLSWGEKNAFALVLFMHYAISQKADLVILDDPISSFDSTKKYAIIYRLFKNNPNQKSLYNKTVLMLSHDFEPIIDFIVNSKPTGGFVSATYLNNCNGNLSEYVISRNDIKSRIVLLSTSAKNESLNVIHRIVFLRQYIEHTNEFCAESHAYNIVSSLIHDKKVIDRKINETEYTPLSDDEIKEGIACIQTFINDFDYEKIRKEIINTTKLLELYTAETNSFLKLQLFRLYLEIDGIRSKIQDNVLLKFIDEIYHIENDYIYYLDFLKFDTVPTHIIDSCDKFIERETGI